MVFCYGSANRLRPLYMKKALCSASAVVISLEHICSFPDLQVNEGLSRHTLVISSSDLSVKHLTSLLVCYLFQQVSQPQIICDTGLWQLFTTELTVLSTSPSDGNFVCTAPD